jgi:2-oxoglutarate ferredoxin oxidoreductase subunit alpha
MNDNNVVIAGAAGQGIQTATTLFGLVLLRSGYYLYANQDAQSRIRGGHNFSSIRFSERPVKAGVKRINFLLCLNEESLSRHRNDLAEDGSIFCLEEVAGNLQDDRLQVVPAELGPEEARNPKFYGIKLLALLTWRLGLSQDLLAQVIGERFADKGEKLVDLNLQVIAAVFDSPWPKEKQAAARSMSTAESRLLISGHEAVALGMIAAGIGVYASYPISPATAILNVLAECGPELGIAVEITEDEIGAANLAIGASYAGVRAAVGTSGAGISLMCEAIGLAGITETPLVLVDGQRSGPATGMATRTEQGDLLFAVHASHGEFPRAILAPTGPEDAFYLTAEAFNIAERWQIPVFILTDHTLADAQSIEAEFDLSRLNIERGEMAPETGKVEELARYRVTESGISPRAFPVVSKWLVSQDSHEHDERGSLTDNPENRQGQMEKRMRKLTGLADTFPAPEVFHAEAATLILCWGSTVGPVLEGVELLREQGYDLGVAIFRYCYPMNRELVRAALQKAERLISLEANFTGQLGKLLLLETGLASVGHIGKSDGRPFTVEDVVSRVTAFLEDL